MRTEGRSDETRHGSCVPRSGRRESRRTHRGRSPAGVDPRSMLPPDACGLRSDRRDDRGSGPSRVFDAKMCTSPDTKEASFHFGRVLQRLILDLDVEGLLYFGSGSGGLLSDEEIRSPDRVCPGRLGVGRLQQLLLLRLRSLRRREAPGQTEPPRCRQSSRVRSFRPGIAAVDASLGVDAVRHRYARPTFTCLRAPTVDTQSFAASSRAVRGTIRPWTGRWLCSPTARVDDACRACESDNMEPLRARGRLSDECPRGGPRHARVGFPTCALGATDAPRGRSGAVLPPPRGGRRRRMDRHAAAPFLRRRPAPPKSASRATSSCLMRSTTPSGRASPRRRSSAASPSSSAGTASSVEDSTSRRKPAGKRET